MTDLERVELAARRAAARYKSDCGERRLLEILADEVLRVDLEKNPEE